MYGLFSVLLDYLRRHLGTCILSTQNEVCSCCMLVACKAQRENESQSLSRRNRQRIVVIVIHKSNITVPADFANAVRKFRRAILLRSCVSVERGFVERVSASTNRSFVRSFGGFSVRVGTAFWWHGRRGFTVAGRGVGGFQSEGAGLQMHCKAIAHRSISCCFSFATRSASSSRFATAIFISIR